MTTSFTRRIFSGIQPTDHMHLGNYLGAVRNWVGLQDEDFETIYCVVDLHALTANQNPEGLRAAIRELVATLLACGIDDKRSILFAQSHVPGHSELAWLFSCVARMGWLKRMTQFKEKAGKKQDVALHGLFAYPVLMAADILLYKGTHVPVGDDQKQHLELTREIAGSFNHTYDQEFFPLPEPLILGPATRVMSLRDGTAKMSKSDPSDYSRINLTDDADAIALKIRKAKTDPEPLPDRLEDLADRPEALNLVTLFAALDRAEPADVLQRFAGAAFSTFKPALAELAVDMLAPITAETKRLMADQAHIDAVLADGAQRAGAIARPILAEVQEIMGLVRL